MKHGTDGDGTKVRFHHRERGDFNRGRGIDDCRAGKEGV